jgi:hypothetical protein
MRAEKNLFTILAELPFAEQAVCKKDPEYFIRKWVAYPEDKVEVITEDFAPHSADKMELPNGVTRTKYIITQPNGYRRTYHFGMTA